ncbi:hypothetical protein BDV59DRAFT_161130 [Aspergillus ambiguus]|uniref:uncharacterized protein n=1 Tax=Aspergillus ambiguus TaxID=176160 RepID=UPI003CCCB94C
MFSCSMRSFYSSSTADGVRRTENTCGISNDQPSPIVDSPRLNPKLPPLRHVPPPSPADCHNFQLIKLLLPRTTLLISFPPCACSGLCLFFAFPFRLPFFLRLRPRTPHLSQYWWIYIFTRPSHPSLCPPSPI